MRAWLISLFLAVMSMGSPVLAQQEPTSVQEYQLSAPPVTLPAPANQLLRLMAYGADGKPVLVILDGVSLVSNVVNGTVVLEAKVSAPPLQLFAKRVVTVIASVSQPTFTVPAAGIFDSLMVFRNGILQSPNHDYSVDAPNRTITFLAAAKARPKDIIHYYWLETQ